MRRPRRPRDRPPIRADRRRRRPTDVVEDVAAWVLACTALLLLVVAVLTGLVVHAGALERGRLESATRAPAEAVLIEDAPAAGGEQGMVRGPVPVAARWLDTHGGSHTGTVTAGAGARAGAAVPVWLDRDGRVVRRPVGDVAAAVAGGLAAVGLLVGGGAVLGACWAGVRRVVGRANSARWEREWERVGPEWSRSVR